MFLASLSLIFCLCIFFVYLKFLTWTSSSVGNHLWLCCRSTLHQLFFFFFFSYVCMWESVLGSSSLNKTLFCFPTCSGVAICTLFAEHGQSYSCHLSAETLSLTAATPHPHYYNFLFILFVALYFLLFAVKQYLQLWSFLLSLYRSKNLVYIDCIG